MPIDPKVESATRSMLDHAMRGRVEEIPPLLEGLDAEGRRACIQLCLLITGYIVVDVCGSRWPSENAVRRIAENAVKAETRLNLNETQVHGYIARTVLNFEPLNQTFPEPADELMAPILITGSLLLTCVPRDKDIWRYLDEIETATEAAESMERYLFPAVIYRSRIPASD